MIKPPERFYTMMYLVSRYYFSKDLSVKFKLCLLISKFPFTFYAGSTTFKKMTVNKKYQYNSQSYSFAGKDQFLYFKIRRILLNLESEKLYEVLRKFY